jgi:hypothetical protein
MRGNPDEFTIQIDTNVHICTATHDAVVKQALTDQGFLVSYDDRVRDAKVLEVPLDQKVKALNALATLQAAHPEYGIAIRTDKFIEPKHPRPGD